VAPAITGGSIYAELHNVVTSMNDDGIVVGREGGVQGTLLLVNRETTGNGDDDLNDDGVDITEIP